MTPAELRDNRQRAQSIAFLRTLRAGDEGQTIYQGVIDDVLAELDAARAEVERARKEAIEEAARVVESCEPGWIRVDARRASARAIRALAATPAEKAREAGPARGEQATPIGVDATMRAGRAALLREVLDAIPQDICPHDNCDFTMCPLTRVNAVISALLDAVPDDVLAAARDET